MGYGHGYTTDSYNTGRVSAVSSVSKDYHIAYAGGIAGYHDDNYQTVRTYNTGDVSASGYKVHAGGIIGRLDNPFHTTRYNIAANANVGAVNTAADGRISRILGSSYYTYHMSGPDSSDNNLANKDMSVSGAPVNSAVEYYGTGIDISPLSLLPETYEFGGAGFVFCGDVTAPNGASHSVTCDEAHPWKFLYYTPYPILYWQE
jgi:hypothetical protein